MNPDLVSPGTQTYRSSPTARFFAFVGGIIASILIPFAITKFLIDDQLGITDQATLIGILFLLMAIGLVMTIARVFFISPVRIIASATTVELWRGIRKKETWARDTTQFSSFVVRTSTNGVPTGSTRKLIAVTRSERVEVPCTWFSPKMFNALIADLAPVNGRQFAAAGGAPAASSAGYPSASPAGYSAAPYQAAQPAGTAAVNGTFTVDHSFVRRGRITVVVIAVVLGILVAALLASSGSPADATAITAVGATLVILLILVPLSAQYRSMPRSITVSPSSLQIDDHTFMINELSSISATPANYRGNHQLILQTQTGRPSRFRFGAATNKTFPEYGQFLATLAAATAYRPGIFTLDVA